MTKILICDDSQEDMTKLKESIIRYSLENNISFKIDGFNKNDEIIAALEKSSGYDLIFLDIYMEALNGINLAQLVRKNNKSVKIVFFSTSKEHALEAYGVNAAQYLVKPVEYAELKNAMDLILDKHTDKSLSFETSDGIIKIKLADFMFSDTQSHYQAITLTNGNVYRVRMSCAALYNMLAENDEFVRAGASFIINLNYVVRITQNKTEFAGGYSLPTPRRSYAELKQRYIDYYTGV